MFEAGDALLFTLSAWKRCSWQQFRRAVDGIQVWPLAKQSQVTREPDQRARRDAVRVLEALGHCDVLFDAGSDAVYAGPSVLARLPLAGLPRAVLCGSRSPDSLRAFREAAGPARHSLRVHSVSQAALDSFAPARIEIQATSGSVMQQAAERVGVIYEPVPPAWSLVSLSGSVEEFLGTLEWSNRPDMTWPRTDFDPARLRFAGRSQPGVPLVLSRYEDPVRGRPVFWMWRGPESAPINDPSWGRYAVLRACGRTVIQYDPAAGALAVPASVPLPRLLSRAATLCSGYAYTSVERTFVTAEGSSLRFQVYRSIPQDVYHTCAAKLGQPASACHEPDH